MKPGIDVDASKLLKALSNMDMSADELMGIGKAGSAIVANNQKTKVPVLTGATRSSINDHIVTSTRERFIDDIGPETEYAPNIEYGRKDMPNYPIQPFVVPSTHGQSRKDALMAMSTSFGALAVKKWKK